jgi:hypothetical protein
MDRADTVNNLIEIGRKKDFEKRESTSLLRIKEMGIKLAQQIMSHSLGVKENMSTSIE